METIKVKDLMVALDHYVCVPQDATLYEAVLELEKAQTKYRAQHAPYRAVLVCDREGKVLGKLAYLDVLRALEPKYSELGDLKRVSGFGLSSEFMKSMLDRYELWKAPLEDLCHKASQVHVGTIVSAPLEGEVIDQDATLNKAIHQIIMGHYQSLLVTSGESVVGILRLSDVFKEVTERIKACKVS
jgi:CBS domain-containing protein